MGEYIDRQADRTTMVAAQIRSRGVRDARVLEAMEQIPREEFVAPEAVDAAYEDHPLPIGHGQTISQPYTVAFMAEAAKISPNDTVLEIGAGSGYGAAVLATLAARVYTIERVPELAAKAQQTLRRLRYDNVFVSAGDGTLGLPDAAPFDAIIVTAGAAGLPLLYLDQLAPGGRIVIPIGRERRDQTMFRFTRSDGELLVEDLGGFAFVPLVGKHGWSEGTA